MGRPINDLKKCLLIMELIDSGKSPQTYEHLKMRFPLIVEEALAIHQAKKRKVKNEPNNNTGLRR